jgi:hypothetical protein
MHEFYKMEWTSIQFHVYNDRDVGKAYFKFCKSVNADLVGMSTMEEKHTFL